MLAACTLLALTLVLTASRGPAADALDVCSRPTLPLSPLDVIPGAVGYRAILSTGRS